MVAPKYNPLGGKTERWNPQDGTPPVDYIVLRVQMYFPDRCGWLWVGATSVYFGITYVCFIPGRHPVIAVGIKYQHRFF